MARGRLSEEEIEILRQNPYVSDVDEARIIYTNEFKHHFMKEYQGGKKPMQIFREAGFDPKILGSKRIERAAHRWKESYASGTLGSYKDASIRKRKFGENLQFERELSYETYLEILGKQRKQIEEQKTELEKQKHAIKELKRLLAERK